MSNVASVAWAVASYLNDANLIDFKPSNGDTWLEAWPKTEIPDAAVLIQTESAFVEYGVHGYTTIVQVTVRGEQGEGWETMQRAVEIYKALLDIPAPVNVVAGNGVNMSLCGSWPTPPMVQREDFAGRPEAILMARISHTDPVDEIA